MKATLTNYRQSPRKVRLVTELIKRKSVIDAIAQLDMMPKRAALPLRKLLLSAVANAEVMGVSREILFIKDARVDEGVALKRSQPVSRGRAHPIIKRSSHVYIELSTRAGLKVPNSVAPKSVKSATQSAPTVAKEVKSEKKAPVAKVPKVAKEKKAPKAKKAE